MTTTMRVLAAALLACLPAAVPIACAATPAGPEWGREVTYRCPVCQEVVRWNYEDGRDPILSRDTQEMVVAHECPDCRRRWIGIVRASSACAACAGARERCPLCARHDGAREGRP